MRSALLSTVVLVAAAAPASAQALSSRFDFNIEAQSLESALLEFSKVSGIQVIAATETLGAKRTQGLRGKVTAEEALEKLLAGTDLTFRSTGSSTVAIRRAESSSARGDANSQYAAADVESASAIIVTAQKREELVIEAPLAVSVLLGQDLESRGQRGVADFIGNVPGVSVRPSSNGLAAIQIRGVSSAIGDGTVGFYLDEIPFSVVSTTISPNMRSFDLDRVEVLRGPQGTLYGQGSMGGTIKLITKAPDLDDFEAKAEVAAGIKKGGEEDYLGNVAVNIPLVEDKLALRVVGSYQKVGGFLDDQTSGRKNVNDYTARNYRAKLLFQPSEDMRITASAWFQRDVSNFSNGGFDDGTLIAGPGGNDVLRVDSNAYNATIEYGLGFADLTSSTSLMDFQFTSNNYSLIAAPGYTSTVDVFSDTDNQIFAQEVRLVSAGKGPINWSIGGLYTKVDVDAVANVDVNAVIPGVVTVGNFSDIEARIDSKAWAVFGEASVELFDGFIEPLIGLRYSHDRRGGAADTAVTSSYDFAGPFPPDSIDTVVTRDVGVGTFTSFNPRFNVAFHFDKSWMSYINVAKGFRSGGFNNAAGVALAESLGITGASSYTSDEIWSYEVGAKADLLGGRLSLEAALYYNDWKDIQLLPTDRLTGSSFVINGGAAHTKGFEFGANYRPIKGLVLQASGNINESVLDEVNPKLSSVLYYKKGDRLDFIPKFQLNGSASYKWDLGGSGDLQGALYGAVNHSSPMWRTTIDGVFPGDAITTVNARAGIQSGRWGVSLYADNLFNEQGRVTSFVDGIGQRLQPRVVGISLRADLP